MSASVFEIAFPPGIRERPWLVVVIDRISLEDLGVSRMDVMMCCHYTG